MTNRLSLVILLLLFSSMAGAAQERYVRPVDDGTKDPTFVAFRAKLIAAAERKDAKFIYGILDPKINLSFGGDQGISDFKSIWKIESKGTSFWREFLTVIKNGGTFWAGPTGKKMFYAPYSFDSFPQDLDVFLYHVIFGSNVNLRESPLGDARILGRLSYNIVTVETVPESEAGKTRDELGWSKVKTLGGQAGWVKNEFVRSPIDYRAGFEKVRGVWKMVVFIAGD